MLGAQALSVGSNEKERWRRWRADRETGAPRRSSWCRPREWTA